MDYACACLSFPDSLPVRSIRPYLVILAVEIIPYASLFIAHLFGLHMLEDIC